MVYRNHLQNGVKKGAFDQAEADRRFEAWMGEKKNKVESKRTNVADSASKAYKDRVAAETKKAQDMAAALTAKLAAAAAPPVAEEAAGEAAPAEGAGPEQA